MTRFFDQLERDLVRAAEQSRPKRRPWVAFTLTATLALGVAGTAAGGTFLALSNSSIAPFAASDVTPEQRVEPGTSRVEPLRAADPDRGVPPWTIRVSQSETGLQCSAIGQVKHGTFGIVGLDGEFRGLPERNADACGEPGTLLGTRVFAARRSRDVRTVLYGVAGTDLERVSVAVGDEPERTIPHSPTGAFVVALRRYPEDAQPTVRLQMRDGSVRRHTFAPGGNAVVPDPFGGRAWKVTAFGFGVATRPGERPRPARLQTVCVNFATARSVAGEPNVSSTPVCGQEAGRRGIKHDPLYFDTRRLSGRGPGRDFLSGNWNGHPPRVAVYGSAREHRDVVVEAGTHRERTGPASNGTFLVLLPPATDPSTVSVTVDGRRYGPTHGTVDPPKGIR